MQETDSPPEIQNVENDTINGDDTKSNDERALQTIDNLVKKKNPKKRVLREIIC